MARGVTYFVLIILSICPIKSIFCADNESASDWSVVPSFVSKLYGDCERKDFEIVDCLKVKVVSLLDRVAKSEVIKLDETISLVRESERGDYGRALSENDVESTLTGAEDKSSTLNSMIFDRISRFLSSHSVKIGFPKIDAASFAKSLEEGRGKMKKTMGMFMMAGMMKAMMMIPLSIGMLFILAGKALIISKIALVLSLLITLKKLLSKPTEHVVHESHGWNSGGSSGGWDKRSYRPQDLVYNPNVAQNLAYSSYTNQ